MNEDKYCFIQMDEMRDQIKSISSRHPEIIIITRIKGLLSMQSYYHNQYDPNHINMSSFEHAVKEVQEDWVEYNQNNIIPDILSMKKKELFLIIDVLSSTGSKHYIVLSVKKSTNNLLQLTLYDPLRMEDTIFKDPETNTFLSKFNKTIPIKGYIELLHSFNKHSSRTFIDDFIIYLLTILGIVYVDYDKNISVSLQIKYGTQKTNTYSCGYRSLNWITQILENKKIYELE